MKKPVLIIFLFVLMVAAQIYVPANMVIEQRRVVSSGNSFKFKTAPIDPNDPFRGKYISLRFNDDLVRLKKSEDWQTGQEAYALIRNDSTGYARIHQLYQQPPAETSDYLKVRIIDATVTQGNEVMIELPFDRFYLEESKAEPAEKIYLESLSDTTRTTYAKVLIKDGNGVLEDVLIDDIPIRELINKKD